MNVDTSVTFAISVSIVIIIVLGPIAYFIWWFLKPTSEKQTKPIKIEEGDFTWAVSVEGRRQIWRLAYHSAEEFPFIYSYRGEIEFNGAIYQVTGFAKNALSVTGPFVLDDN